MGDGANDDLKAKMREALDAFDKALKINPSASEVLAARGVAALQQMEVKDAERFAERALKFNPHLPEALRLRADIHLFVDGEKDMADDETTYTIANVVIP